MEKRTYMVLFMAVLLQFLGVPREGDAQVRLNIAIGAPPVYVAPAPPPVVVIPGTSVYFAPDLGVDILFYHGAWYRPYEGRWYSGRSYNGPWAYVSPGRVPPALVSLPGDYRRVPPGHARIPYGDLKKNWARWEREKHWEGHGERRDEGPRGHEGPGHGEEHGRGR